MSALPPIATKHSPGTFIDSESTIETKLFRLEKVNETLLEEIVHLQGELNALRKPESDELRLIRSQLKRIVERQDLLQSRVTSEEQKSLEKEQALTYLLQSSREFERKAINNQQIVLCKRDIVESQFTHLQNGMIGMQEKWRIYQDQMELKLSEDSERLEKVVEAMKMQHREQLVAVRNMKLALETRCETLAEEMNHKLLKLHELLEHTNNKVSILGSELLEECDGQRKESNRWLSKLQEDIRDLNKRINNCDVAAHDRDAQLQVAMDSLQQRCHKEHLHQAELVQQCEKQLDKTSKLFQVTIQSKVEKKIEAQSRQSREEYRNVQSQLQREKVKVSQLLGELHKSIDIIQKEMELTKEDTNKVIFAEIASRFREFDGVREQHSKLLQQLDEMRNELSDFTTKHCRHQIEQMFNETMTGVVGKLESSSDHVEKLTTQMIAMESRLTKLSCDQSQLQQDSLVWREETVSSLDGLQVALSPLTEQFSQLEEKVEIHQHDLSSRMEGEWLERRAKLKELQKQITYCVTMDTYQQQIASHDQRILSLEGRVHNVALSNTKLENSIHKIETKLSMETKQRLSAMQQIREQINLLQPHPQMIRRTSSTTPVPATPTNRIRPHRKLHNRHRPNSASSPDDTNIVLIQQNETQGVFTSAPATPESQQNLIVQDVSHDQESSPISQNVMDQSHSQHHLFDDPADQSGSVAATNDHNVPPDDQLSSPNEHPPIQANTHSITVIEADKTSPTHSSN